MRVVRHTISVNSWSVKLFEHEPTFLVKHFETKRDSEFVFFLLSNWFTASSTKPYINVCEHTIWLITDMTVKCLFFLKSVTTGGTWNYNIIIKEKQQQIKSLISLISKACKYMSQLKYSAVCI